MLHRCAFDARSSVALSAHLWNLLSDSLTEAFILAKTSLPSDFRSLFSQTGCGSILSLVSIAFHDNLFFPKSHSVQHLSTSFSMHHFFSQHSAFPFFSHFRKVEKKKKFRCALLAWNGKKKTEEVLFLGTSKEIYSKNKIKENKRFERKRSFLKCS